MGTIGTQRRQSTITCHLSHRFKAHQAPRSNRGFPVHALTLVYNVETKPGPKLTVTVVFAQDHILLRQLNEFITNRQRGFSKLDLEVTIATQSPMGPSDCEEFLRCELRGYRKYFIDHAEIAAFVIAILEVLEEEVTSPYGLTFDEKFEVFRNGTWISEGEAILRDIIGTRKTRKTA